MRGVLDSDIQSAIEQLQNSTAAIEKHTATLRTQQEAVAALVKDNGQHHAARAAVESTQFRMWTEENNQIRSAVSDASKNGLGDKLNCYYDRSTSYFRI